MVSLAASPESLQVCSIIYICTSTHQFHLVESRIRANRPARSELPRTPNDQGFHRNTGNINAPCPEDDAEDEEDGEPTIDNDEDGHVGAAHRFRIVSVVSPCLRNDIKSLVQSLNITPTVNSYPSEVQPVVKLTNRLAKPWIIACGTFDWRAGDPGKKVPTSDTIVARCFAQACRELQTRLTFRDDHVRTVSPHTYSSRLSTNFLSR